MRERWRKRVRNLLLAATAAFFGRPRPPAALGVSVFGDLAGGASSASASALRFVGVATFVSTTRRRYV